MPKQEQTNFFIGSFITSAIGAAFLLFGTFGGWYDYWFSGSAHHHEYGYIYFGLIKDEGIFATILIGSFALALLYGSYVSYLGASNPQNLSYSTLHKAYLASIYAIVGICVGALIFVIAVMGNDDWWLDEGFYGGIIGSILTFLLLKKQLEYYLQEQNQE